jgi:hypothetical protein
MIIKISQFTILINKIDKSHLIWIKDKKWKELNSTSINNTFLLGHNGANMLTGEFVCIDLTKDAITIYNDVFGAIPVYLYETDTHFGITNSLFKLNQLIPIQTDIIERQFYEYFIFGFQVNDNQSYYKYIKSIQRQFKVSCTLSDYNISIRMTNESFYSDNNGANSKEPEDISKILRSETEIGLECLNGTSSLLLSGGKDSLLGGLLVKSIYKDKNLTSATFGLQDSQDIVLAKVRSEKIFKSTHNEFLIDDFNITQDDFINHAIAQNGFGTLSSIFYSFFIKHLNSLGITNAFFSDHFECTRKEIPDMVYLRERYTTPSNVVMRYIRDQEAYNYYLTDAINNIQNNYGLNACYKFYYHDRNQRGQAWKMMLCNEYGLVKYNLSNHIRFLNKNYHDVNYENNFNYNHLVDIYSQKCGISKLESEGKYANYKNIPVDPRKLIYDHSAFFIDTLNNNINLSLNRHFNLESISHDIENRTITDNGEWLILRLLNLTLFNTFLNHKL